MRKTSILMISYHFYPSNEVGAKRPSETAKYLDAAGYDVTVIRGIERHNRTKKIFDTDTGLRVISVAIPRKWLTESYLGLKRFARRYLSGTAETNQYEEHDDNGHFPEGSNVSWIRRQFLAVDTLFQGNKLWLLKSILREFIEARARQFDIVIASGPPMVGYICGLVASNMSNARLILDFRDPWYLHGSDERKSDVIDHPLSRWENSFAKACILRSNSIVVASPGIRRHINENYDLDNIPIKLIRNGFDDSAVIDDLPPSGRLNMLYAGSLYWNRNPFPFLEALRKVVDQIDVDRSLTRFTMVGNCDIWNGVMIKPWIDRHGLSDIVQILPHANTQELRKLVEVSNVLINFAQGQPRQIPAKSYEYIASQRDLLVFTEADSDVADLFIEAGIGEILSSNDSGTIVAAILSLYEKHVDRGYRPDITANGLIRYSRITQLAEFERHIQATLS